jgi:pilus assembly protein Flp/PilA
MVGAHDFSALRCDDGASAVEYGLLIAGIAALIVAVVFLFGGMVNDVFGSTCNNIKSGADPYMAVSCS